MKRAALLLVMAVTTASPARTLEPPLPPPPIHHFYIGSFGPRDNPVAAFKCGDEIVNARTGQTVDGCMVECIEPEWLDMVTPEGRRFRMVLDQWQVCADAAGYYLNYWTEAKDASARVTGAYAGP